MKEECTLGVPKQKVAPSSTAEEGEYLINISDVCYRLLRSQES